MSDDYLAPLSEAQLKALMSPLNQGRISSRNQGGASLSYLQAWDVKATLIRMFGFGGFDAEVIDSKIVEVDRNVTNSRGEPAIEVLAQSTVRLHIKQLGCIYTETAVASHKGKEVGEVADFAVKTASSDALKRCAIYLGTQFGLSLYANTTNDVVRIVLAPGQEFPTEAVEPTADQAETLARSLGAASAGSDPSPNEDVNG